MSVEVSFQATVARVRTLVDGGRRIELDLPETAGEAFAILAECQRFGEVLAVTAVGTGRSKRHEHKRRGGDTFDLGKLGATHLEDEE